MKTKKIKLSDVTKIADIYSFQVLPATQRFLFDYFIIYQDTLLKEHLIDIHHAVEMTNNNILMANVKEKDKKAVVKQIVQMANIANKEDAAYIRLTN